MRFGVIRFPGSCDEVDAVLACERVPGSSATLLWHGDRDLQGVEAVVVPGGFSYGDYLRVGAIARFSPVMESVIRFARDGGLVLGICNGFQVLCEAGLLPGALLPNVERRFICRQVNLSVEQAAMPFLGDCSPGELLSIPVKHTTGRYYAPPQMLEVARGTRARCCCATRTMATPTGPPTTSPACPTRAATSSGSCPTPSMPSTR